MRVVGGIFRGRVLEEFKGYEIRPTSDMVRESLFNILRDRIGGAHFLDLFCGTGAVGIEALSRGAKKVVFNDLSRESVALTKKNIEKLKIENGYTVRQSDALIFLENSSENFDIIFIDAPYKDEVGIKAVELAKNKLNDGGIIIYENDMPFTAEIEGLNVYDKRKYGRAHLTFFKSDK